MANLLCRVTLRALSMWWTLPAQHSPNNRQLSLRRKRIRSVADERTAGNCAVIVKAGVRIRIVGLHVFNCNRTPSGEMPEARDPRASRLAVFEGVAGVFLRVVGAGLARDLNSPHAPTGARSDVRTQFEKLPPGKFKMAFSHPRTQSREPRRVGMGRIKLLYEAGIRHENNLSDKSRDVDRAVRCWRVRWLKVTQTRRLHAAPRLSDSRTAHPKSPRVRRVDRGGQRSPDDLADGEDGVVRSRGRVRFQGRWWNPDQEKRLDRPGAGPL
ncbi:hypothetical protein DFH07DRAFT_935543 [Mycena maculata]|uniref:Uncharacterized protein n=1 Tax=Mycena maculata TaxID=230809 RepID=A0AAD7KFW9_9AGAR|nr:hypothetical protein DFH07DRAFT_935543 [Mycena maculata]